MNYMFSKSPLISLQNLRETMVCLNCFENVNLVFLHLPPFLILGEGDIKNHVFQLFDLIMHRMAFSFTTTEYFLLTIWELTLSH